MQSPDLGGWDWLFHEKSGFLVKLVVSCNFTRQRTARLSEKNVT